MRLLVWLILGVLVYLAIRKNMRTPDTNMQRPTWSTDEQNSEQHVQAHSPGKPSEMMVSCAHCQVFIPSSEAVRRGTQVFCCDEHAQQFTA